MTAQEPENEALNVLLRDVPELRERLRATGKEWSLDVRGLAPPEPMELTLLVLDRLPNGCKLTQMNSRVPQFLIPMLDERGYQHEAAASRDGSGYIIRISRKEGRDHLE